MAGPNHQCARFAGFTLNLRTHELLNQGVRVKLQAQPLEVLALLVEKRGELVTREELRQRLWGADTYVDFDQGLNKTIKKIRAALGDSADEPKFVQTLARRGYRFIASVSWDGECALTTDAPSAGTSRYLRTGELDPVDTRSGPQEPDPAEKLPGGRWGRHRWLVLWQWAAQWLLGSLLLHFWPTLTPGGGVMSRNNRR